MEKWKNRKLENWKTGKLETRELKNQKTCQLICLNGHAKYQKNLMNQSIFQQKMTENFLKLAKRKFYGKRGWGQLIPPYDL